MPDDFITREEFKKSCEDIIEKIDNMRDNHLDTIFNAIVYMTDLVEKKMNRVYWLLGGSITLLTVVIALTEHFR